MDRCKAFSFGKTESHLEQRMIILLCKTTSNLQYMDGLMVGYLNVLFVKIDLDENSTVSIAGAAT